MTTIQATQEYKRLISNMPARVARKLERTIRQMVASGIKLTIWDLVAFAKTAT